MIKRLYVDNYKCLVNFDLPLQELSLLLGPSGTGKTSVLDIIFALRRLLSGDARVADPDIFPDRTLTCWQSRELQVFEIQAFLQSETFTYRLEVEHQRSAHLSRISREKLEVEGTPLFDCVQGEVQLFRDDPSGRTTEGPVYSTDWRESALARVAPGRSNERLTRFLEYMGRVLVCGVNPPVLQAESTEENSVLQRDARNFADWYRHTLQERPDLYFELKRTLTDVIGAGFDGIRLERVGTETRALMVAFANQADTDSGLTYPLRFDRISDGQRALIVLYSLIHLAGGGGYTLFLDEPENYVALRELQPWLMSLENACGDVVSQAVVSSHHPELIDYLGYESGIMLQRETSGVITVSRPQTKSGDGTEDTIGLKLSELVARGWEQ